MPRQHREFLEYLETVTCVRQFIIDSLMTHGITSDMRSEKIPVGPPQQAHRSYLGNTNIECTRLGLPLTDAELKNISEKKVKFVMSTLVILFFASLISHI